MSTDQQTSNQQRIASLVHVAGDAVRQGLVLASGGNLSHRLEDGTVAVSGKGTWLDRLDVDQFAILSPDGTPVSGPTPSSEWKLHTSIYEARPDAQAIIHIHPQFTLLLTALGHKVRFITQDHAFYVGSYGYTKYYTNGSDELAETAADQLRDGTHDVVVLGNHGIAALGDSIESAYRKALNMEEAAKLTYHALLLGDQDTVFPPEELAKLHHH
ncbi:class II aldolase/adducin family protein [Propionibacteriaceae bacterium G1746]|uniref:class II aldolase/adducin family protein n=1 Tax=Aestuariimicrobium sp. G57 TaxID=3418485 RepID=UPI003C232FA7